MHRLDAPRTEAEVLRLQQLLLAGTGGGSTSREATDLDAPGGLAWRLVDSARAVLAGIHASEAAAPHAQAGSHAVRVENKRKHEAPHTTGREKRREDHRAGGVEELRQVCGTVCTARCVCHAILCPHTCGALRICHPPPPPSPVGSSGDEATRRCVRRSVPAC